MRCPKLILCLTSPVCIGLAPIFYFILSSLVLHFATKILQSVEIGNVQGTLLLIRFVTD